MIVNYFSLIKFIIFLFRFYNREERKRSFVKTFPNNKNIALFFEKKISRLEIKNEYIVCHLTNIKFNKIERSSCTIKGTNNQLLKIILITNGSRFNNCLKK